MALVNMNINIGTKAAPGPCFAMYGYYAGPIDVTAALKAVTAYSVDKTSDLGIKPLGEKTVIMNTSEGPKEFQVHQYEFTGEDSRSMAKGVQFAYVPLKDGYIQIKGYCETADELVGSELALSAVGFKLNSNN